jgi:hypothetical protein
MDTPARFHPNNPGNQPFDAGLRLQPKKAKEKRGHKLVKQEKSDGKRQG